MLRRFQPAVAEWFESTFGAPTPAQVKGWPPIHAGQSTLILAPTGSGKTLAAFLAAIDRLMFTGVARAPASGHAARAKGPARRREEGRSRILYISPLKALAVDIERNLRAPIAGIAGVAERRGDAFRLPTVAIRSGDTPADDRRRMAREPPDILITTPESLFLILTSQARRTLAGVETVIVDEIHSLVATKRGAHLALSLERVEELAGGRLQRIGLSATQRPLDVVARFLGGLERGAPRPVSVVDAGSQRALELKVEVPQEAQRPDAEPAREAALSAWPAIHPRLLELIRQHRTTLLFVNSRRLSERLAAALNDLAGEPLVRAHHGSLAREERLAVEEALKAGALRAIVATSSLELGIDMGAIDLVVQIEAPPSVAHGLQRVGRSGHRAGAVARGVIVPKYRGDLLATAAVTRAMREGAVEETRLVENALDVLAQHLVSLCALEERQVEDLFRLTRRAAPYARLPRASFDGVLDMLSGRYPSDEFADLRPRVTWDRRRGLVRAREGARRVVVANAGTIPDRGLFGVFLAEETGGAARGARRVAELDEEMVFESRPGDVLVLGASSWRIVEIERDRVLVAPAPGQPGRVPFWHGDRPGRPVETGLAIGRLTRLLAGSSRAEAGRRLVEEHALDDTASRALLDYLDEQKRAGALPDDRTLVVERLRDELGDWRLCLLSPLGGRVHAAWALAIEARARRAGRTVPDTMWSDDGIVVHLPDRDEAPTAELLLPEPEEIEALVVEALTTSALFAAHFREASARALLLPRRRPGQRTPLWMQRRRAGDLLGVAARHASFPIILETYRECLKDVLDVPALVDLARRVQQGAVRVVTVDSIAPSPFASSLLFGYVANYIYEGDAPLAERRAQALAIDQRQLRELLGEAELRELFDPGAVAEVEAALQGLGSGQRLRGADGLHDLLLRLGPLTAEEIESRVAVGIDEVEAQREDARRQAHDWSAALLRAGRAFLVGLGSAPRLAAVEDAGRLRDGCGAEVPDDLPAVFLETIPEALDQLVARHARTHGPFGVGDLTARFGIDTERAQAALLRLSQDGRVLEGEFRPAASGREWCDAAVLSRLRRASLARWRRQLEPAEPAALARLLLAWQGVDAGSADLDLEEDGEPASGLDALLDAIEKIQGAAVPASALESDVLPVRLPGYRAQDLDTLCAAGEIVWCGRGRLGDGDGRVALYFADDLPLLHAPAAEGPGGETHAAIRACLARQGATFFPEICATAGAPAQMVLDALWDLVWAGEVTNDSLAPLRAQRLAGQILKRRYGRRLRPYHSRPEVPPTAVGRWSLVPQTRATATESLARLAEQLVLRHGVVTRDAVLAEGRPGGFAALYPVLAALEERGRLRRGYFVAGLGGAQFAEPAAIERLRAKSEDEGDPPGVVLAAADPANAYGATLPWPRQEALRLARVAGAHVVLVDGALAAFVERDERDLVLFLPEAEPERSRVLRAMARALGSWARRSGHFLLGWSAGEAGWRWMDALRPHLVAVGYAPTGRGFRLRSRDDAE